MKFLGIDFGSKKLGLSTSDDRGEIAFPHSVVSNDKSLIGKVLAIIEKEEVEAIVIGRSLNYKQEENQIMILVNEFKKELEKKFSGPIYLQNETLSTKEASNIQGREGELDARASAIVLQSFIDGKRPN